MGQRFYTMLGNVFGTNPIVFFAPRLGPMLQATVFVSSNTPKLWSRAADPDVAKLVAQHPPPFPLNVRDAPPPTTDDWPYVYHRNHSIPFAYLVVSLILLLVTIPLIRRAFDPRKIYTWHFFLLGAGFLLLEAQMVSRLALYFGTTWLVTSTVITAILLMLVLANLYVAAWQPIRVTVYSFLLVVSFLVNYVFPWHQLPYSTRTVGLLMLGAYSVSIFLAGIIFTAAFRRSMRRSSAFGANIVGAVAGGLSQNVSFIFGMKALLLLAALFYGLAALTGFLKPKGNT